MDTLVIHESMIQGGSYENRRAKRQAESGFPMFDNGYRAYSIG
jgi:hypothetical protein